MSTNLITFPFDSKFLVNNKTLRSFVNGEQKYTFGSAALETEILVDSHQNNNPPICLKSWPIQIRVSY